MFLQETSLPLERESRGEAGNAGAEWGAWYVVQCITLKEEVAARFLEDHLGVHSYLPTVLRRRQGGTELVPFFPGYIFVQADLSTVKLSSINSSPGVIRLLGSKDEPQSLEEAVVEDIRMRLLQLNSGGGLPTHNFRPGDAVRVKSGPLKGLEAAFVGQASAGSRVKILLEFLGRQNEVKVEADDLERVSVPLVPRRERGTRGHRRKINNSWAS